MRHAEHTKALTLESGKILPDFEHLFVHVLPILYIGLQIICVNLSRFYDLFKEMCSLLD